MCERAEDESLELGAKMKDEYAASRDVSKLRLCVFFFFGLPDCLECVTDRDRHVDMHMSAGGADGH